MFHAGLSFLLSIFFGSQRCNKFRFTCIKKHEVNMKYIKMQGAGNDYVFLIV